MKRWIAAIVSFVLLMGCVPLGAVSAIAQEVEREEFSVQPRAAGSTWYDRRASDFAAANGDVNDDGRINNRDAATLQKYINEWEIAVHEEAAATDNNGRINNRDLGLLLRYLNGMADLPTDD